MKSEKIPEVAVYKGIKQIKFTFYDGYDLTKSAIDGSKTQRRMIARWKRDGYGKVYLSAPCFEVGDEVVIIQPYKDVPGLEGKGLEKEQGWYNKMFTKVDKMPYKVVILERRLERLQKITDEDALAEGVKVYKCKGQPDVYSFYGNDSLKMYATPREAFAAMCDGLYGIGIWRRDPYVYVYKFKVEKVR